MYYIKDFYSIEFLFKVKMSDNKTFNIEDNIVITKDICNLHFLRHIDDKLTVENYLDLCLISNERSYSKYKVYTLNNQSEFVILKNNEDYMIINSNWLERVPNFESIVITQKEIFAKKFPEFHEQELFNFLKEKLPKLEDDYSSYYHLRDNCFTNICSYDIGELFINIIESTKNNLSNNFNDYYIIYINYCENVNIKCEEDEVIVIVKFNQ